MTAGRINQVCMQPVPIITNIMPQYCYHYDRCCTNGKWACEVWLHQQQLGKLTNSKHLWATLPHYHHEHNLKKYRHQSKPRAESTKSLLLSPNLPLTVGMVVTTQNLEHKELPLPMTTTPPPCVRTLSQMPPCNVPSVYANQSTFMYWFGSERHQMTTKAQPLQFPIVVM